MRAFSLGVLLALSWCAGAVQLGGGTVLALGAAHAETGTIAGTVTSLASGIWIEGATVTCYQALASSPPGTYVKGPLMGTTLTAADGRYSFTDLSVGSYFIVVDGTGVGFGTAEKFTTVTAGGTTTLDVALGPPPGTLVATVTRTDTLAAVPGALVQARRAGVLVGSAFADGLGVATLSLDPDTYTVVASSPGLGVSAPQTVTITSAATTNTALALTPSGTGSLCGRIVSASSGRAVGGITIHAQFNGVDVVAPVVSTSSFTDPGGDATPYNFRFPSLPSGILTIAPAVADWTVVPAQRTATIVVGQETTGVTFSLFGVYALLPRLQLMSTPYDYEFFWDGTQDANDPAIMLGLNPGTLQLATYLPNENRYQFYPLGPADHFRLGRGYWLNLPMTQDVVRVGALGPDPFDIPLQTGWNLIGCPFTQRIDLTTASIIDASGTHTFAEAVNATNPKLQGVLFAYVLGGYQSTLVLSPWAGYWIRAFEPMTLRVGTAVGGFAAATRATTTGVPVPAGGWVLPLEVRAGACVDTATYLAQGKEAAVNYSAGLDLIKPPAVDFQPYVYAALLKADAPGPLALDVRPLGGRQVWDVAVTTNQTGAQVVVRWPDLSQIPNDLRPVLEDVATGQKVYMRTTSSYEFTATGAERRLRITMAAGASGPAMVSALTAQSARGRATIVYTLGTDGATTVEIRNVSGRLVRRVLIQQPQGAGVQTVSWDGKNESGAAVPPGRYLVSVSVVTPEGGAATALASVFMQNR